jgi:hypothetical protein
MKLSVSLDADRLERLLRAAPRAGLETMGREIHDTALVAFAESQMEVPLDLGTLMRSGFVSPPERGGNTIEVTISYGGAASLYAMRVHEGVGMKFQNGRKAKYLSDPTEAAVVGLDRRIAERLQSALGGA